MKLRDAIDLIRDAGVEALGTTTWADLGCGDGTFTLALADLLAVGSTIRAMDRDVSALRKIPSTYGGASITTHRGDFAKDPWPFTGLNGILMANSLHYVRDQTPFIQRCRQQLTPDGCFLIVEYDADQGNRWVPYPVSKDRLMEIFASAGYSSIKILGSRPSVYRRAPIYAALITIATSSTPTPSECRER